MNPVREGCRCVWACERVSCVYVRVSGRCVNVFEREAVQRTYNIKGSHTREGSEGENKGKRERVKRG